MDVTLYRLEVLKGKENIAEEWLSFLNTNKEKGVLTLKKENVYFETYFKEIIDNTMYIYLFIMCKNLEAANQVALNSSNEIDLKHFEYMKKCINTDKSNVMNPELFLDNIEDKNKKEI